MRTIVLATLCIAFLSAGPARGNWWEKIKLSGDLRYRHETIDKECEPIRHRHRIRARIGIEGRVNSSTIVKMQFATGSDNPVSTNQSLGDGFSSKNVRLDLAYIKVTHDAVPGLTVQGGKFENPFFKPGRSELLWDSDLNPEGGVAGFSVDSRNASLRVIGAGLYIEERKADEDSWMAAAQGVFEYNLNDQKSSVAFGCGFYDYENAADHEPFFDGEPMGNMVDVSSGHYVNNFRLLEWSGEFTHQFGAIPVVVMGDYVTNTAADSLDNGWLTGIRIGKAKENLSWACRYIYREVEPDAVVGTFTDSDFRGGGTDANGHEIGGSMQLARNTTFNVTYFMNRINPDKENLDFRRLQVDLQLKFL
jgi:hypothetical protein